jgi:hypothetical protein
MSGPNTNGGEPIYNIDSPENYTSVPNDTYFKDDYLGVMLYKTAGGVIINPWVNNSVLRYKALITQYSTLAPYSDNLSYGTASAFEDTIGGTWSYISTGVYRYTKAGAFSNVSKINIEISANNYNNGGSDIIVWAEYVDANSIAVKAGRLAAFLSPTTVTPLNGKINIQPITIEIYP